MLVVLGFLMVPYHAEKYILLFDLDNMKISEIPYSVLFDLLGKMNLYYTGNMDKTLIYNFEGLSLFLKVLDPFIPEHAKKKMKFI